MERGDLWLGPLPTQSHQVLAPVCTLAIPPLTSTSLPRLPVPLHLPLRLPVRLFPASPHPRSVPWTSSFTLLGSLLKHHLLKEAFLNFTSL